MKPNFIVPEHTFGEDGIANRNLDIERLYQALLPFAKSLIKGVVLPRMAQASAEMPFPDIQGLVDQISDAELNYVTSDRQRPGEFRETLKDLLAADSSPEYDDDWLQRRAEDLALVVVLFWLELGANTQERLRYSRNLLKERCTSETKNHPASDDCRDFRLIAARFYLADEAFDLLERLNELGSGKASFPFHVPKE